MGKDDGVLGAVFGQTVSTSSLRGQSWGAVSRRLTVAILDNSIRIRYLSTQHLLGSCILETLEAVTVACTGRVGKASVRHPAQVLVPADRADQQEGRRSGRAGRRGNHLVAVEKCRSPTTARMGDQPLLLTKSSTVVEGDSRGHPG